MILTQLEIQELKKDIIKIDFFTLEKDEVTLEKLYLRCNRTPYETALLFINSYQFALTLQNKKLDNSLKEDKNLMLLNNLYYQMDGYHSYINCAGHTAYEARMRILISNNSVFVNELIDLVFGKLLIGAKKDEKPEWQKRVEALKKENKPKEDEKK